MFYGALSFNQDIGKWPITTDCDTDRMFDGCLIEKETFEGKLYGGKKMLSTLILIMEMKIWFGNHIQDGTEGNMPLCFLALFQR